MVLYAKENSSLCPQTSAPEPETVNADPSNDALPGAATAPTSWLDHPSGSVVPVDPRTLKRPDTPVPAKSRTVSTLTRTRPCSVGAGLDHAHWTLVPSSR